MRHDEISIYIRETLGHNIKALRESTGASQSAFAQMVSIDRSYINQIEAGKENVTVDILVKFADGLDVPITALFYGLGDVPPREQVLKPPKPVVHYSSASLKE